MNKDELLKANDNDIVIITNQQGVEAGIRKILERNIALLPKTITTDRIINSAGFYISNKPELLQLSNQNKLLMLYGVLKEAMIGNFAGEDYDILVYGGKPSMSRTREGWYKIIDLIKPAEIIKFVVNVATTGDEISYNPAMEEVTHVMHGIRGQEYKDIVGAYAYIKFSNGFEKSVYMTKQDIDFLRSKSPSANGKGANFSPWNSNSIRMVKTKVAKELAKELFQLFKGKLNYVLQKASMVDDAPVQRINNDGYIITDDAPYTYDNCNNYNQQPQQQEQPPQQQQQEQPQQQEEQEFDMSVI